MWVFMLGWEFPPYISGGLGTACYGLTRAMSRQGVEITFVLPRPIAPDHAAVHDAPARLLSPPSPGAAGVDQRADSPALPFKRDEPGFENVTFRPVPTHLSSPYQRAHERWEAIDRHIAALREAREQPGSVLHEPRAESDRYGRSHAFGFKPSDVYSGDLFAEADHYARLCVELARREHFDVIHAHDWLSFPAGMAVAGATGKPLIVHVHSTEFDRAGENIQQPIYEIERRGLHAAVRIITVSHFTRRLIEQRYGIESERIEVIYNGIATETPGQAPSPAADSPSTTAAASHGGEVIKRNGERIVLFLGRVTRQKGPCYFIEAAKKVLEKMGHAKFVITGSGDQVPEMIEMAARFGIGSKVHFTGFLEGASLERVFQQADVYVMPSVSEPFGLAAMEAIRHDVPTIVSRTSGVSEALRHVLKVDFWNTDEIADKILAVLNHPPLADLLCHNADRELDQFTWDAAARHCRRLYEQAIAAMP